MNKLKNVLTVNALSSGATGIILIAFDQPITSIFGIESNGPIIGVGIFLSLFALLVFKESRKDLPQSNAVRFIVALDILWVVTSFTLVLLQLFQLTTIGYVLISAIALWVALMAVLQIRGLKLLNIPNV